jgi:hypothetical protein
MRRAPRIGFGVANLGVAALVAWAVFHGLPNRYWPVDLGAAVVALLMATSGAALLARSKRAAALTRLAAGVALALGLALVGALAISAAFLWGTCAPIGRGGAAIFVLGMLLAIPYLVVLPAAELLWIGPRRPS